MARRPGKVELGGVAIWRFIDQDRGVHYVVLPESIRDAASAMERVSHLYNSYFQCRPILWAGCERLVGKFEFIDGDMLADDLRENKAR